MPNKHMTKADLIRELESVSDDTPIWVGMGEIYEILPLVEANSGQAEDGTPRFTLFGDYIEYPKLPLPWAGLRGTEGNAPDATTRGQ